MRKSLKRIFPQSCSLFSASRQTFCLTVRSYLNRQKYGLFWGLCLGQKIPKIPTLFRTTPSIFLPWLGQRSKCTPPCFQCDLLAIPIEKIHVMVFAFVYLEYKQNSSSKSNPSCRQYPVDRLTRNYIPCLGKTYTRLYTLFITERKKTKPWPAAHPCVGHLIENPTGKKPPCCPSLEGREIRVCSTGLTSSYHDQQYLHIEWRIESNNSNPSISSF